jgi:thioesterase domain-containing protein/acyl transferase domain-containing protein
LKELFRAGDRVLLEVGPGQVLTTLTRQQAPASSVVYQSLRHQQQNVSDSRFALQALGRVWVSGIPVDWTGLHASTSSRRVSLPTYPFEHRRFWIDPDPHTGTAVAPASPVRAAEDPAEDPIAKWLYRRKWAIASLLPASATEGSRWILFTDSAELGRQLGSELKARGQDVRLIKPGSAYRRVSAYEYTIRPDNRSDYDLLVGDLFEDGPNLVKIIYLWSASPADAERPLETALGRSFYGILYLTQALAETGASTADVTVVSNRIQSVRGEPVVDPTSAVSLGPVRVVPKELPGFQYRAVDVDLENDSVQDCSARIVAEASAASSDTVVAYRRGERFHEVVERLTPRHSGDALKPKLVKGGVYLSTGGLGGIGLVVAEQMAREFSARLVLVGRTELPPESDWESCLERGSEPEAIRDKIRRLLEIRNLGSELLVLKADVTSIDDMREVVTRGRKQFGKIEGVFHLAGSIDDGSLIGKLTESATAVIDAKVRGTLILEEVLRDEPISCFVLFSSVSSFVAPAGQVDYAAANAFLDAFALSRRGPVIAIDWGLWRDVGLGLTSRHPLLQQTLAETPETKLYSSRLSQERHWLLAEHKLRNGKALIPGTAYLEMAAAALNRGSLSSAVELRDVFFLAPLTFDALEAKEVHIELKREGDTFRFSILARQGEWTEHATGAITRSTARQPAVLDRAALAKRCAGRVIEFDDLRRTKQEQYFDFGPRWRAGCKLRLGNQECLAELELPKDVAGDVSRWYIHPALLDMATGFALYSIEGYENSNSLYLPVSYKTLRSYRRLPAKLYSYVRGGKNTADQEIAIFDITLFDERGRVLIEAEGFQMRRIAEPFGPLSWKEQAARALPGEVNYSEPGREGIPSLEGARALVHILQTLTLPLVVVSAQDFQAGSSPTPGVSRKIARTSAPVNDVEATLAGWWQELLGVERVGLDDDFFDLGGHSLIAVRLFGKIKKTYRFDLDLTALFEARTIRQLAQLIHAGGKPQLRETSVWSPLVAIQPNGSKAPLFLAHPVGPSLLPYKTLANYLGSDQPVYGLQSPLASGGPSTSMRLEDLASIYLEAVRKSLPQGPYLFGGYSLGGLIAFEMSRQLSAQGQIPDRLVLLDTSTREIPADIPRGHRIARIWQNFQNERFSYVFNRVRSYWEQFLRNHITEISRAFRAAGKSLPVGLRHIAVEETHKRIMYAYELQPFPGKIILLRSLDGRRQAKNGDPTLGWSEFARGGVEIVDVPGDHLSILRDGNVNVLASALKSVLPG